jgi:hypothetical protein
MSRAAWPIINTRVGLSQAQERVLLLVLLFVFFPPEHVLIEADVELLGVVPVVASMSRMEALGCSIIEALERVPDQERGDFSKRLMSTVAAPVRAGHRFFYIARAASMHPTWQCQRKTGPERRSR